MIGKMHDAARALDMNERLDHSMVLSDMGSTRTVYLIDGIVYKVGDDASNIAEYDKINNVTELPDGVFFPKVNLFLVGEGRAVIAMEYIEGQAVSECYCIKGESHDDTCMDDDVKNIVSQFIFDTGGENVIITDSGDIYIIDAAE